MTLRKKFVAPILIEEGRLSTLTLGFFIVSGDAP